MTTSPPPRYSNVADESVAGAAQEPPKYEDVRPDRPPSYDSLFGEIRQARQESSSMLDFWKKFFVIFVSTIGCTIFLALLLALPIASIIIGAQRFNDCPVQPKIPIYLIVIGSFGILRNLIGLFNQVKRRMDGETESDSRKTSCEGLVDCFLIAWFIAGNVWIYSNYQPDYDNPSSPHYCDKVLYLFAFGLTTASYVFVGCVCCCMCCVAFCLVVSE